ncbi:penicillin acylase family protein [Peribacillus butanolivorans]|uniref:penicillin acylase family protein n=1 Tax=Peribacillus butanolivorans TaxID=421767 RepID=UPI0036D95AE0
MILYLKLQVTSINTRGSPAVSKIDERNPKPGTGEYELKGFIPFKENPHVINPKNGYIVNWNNKPAKEWTNGELGWKREGKLTLSKVGYKQNAGARGNLTPAIY